MKNLRFIFDKIIHLPKKFLIIAVIILAGAGFFIYRSQTNNGPTLQFATVKKQDIASTVSSSGSLTGKQTANLKFKSSGKLAYINVKPGDSVFKGQVIAGLDTQSFNIILQQAYNTLRDKQAIVEKIEDDLKDHDKDETYAQRVTRTTAQVARDSAADSVKEAKRAFQDALIVSPIAGIVTQAPIISGQNVTSTDLIAQVVDFSSFYFDTDIDEADLGKISLGQQAKVTLDAYPKESSAHPGKTWDGSVDEITPQTKTTSSGATVVTVKINLGDLKLTPVNGLSGQAAIILSEKENVLTIPVEALREDKTVFVKNDKGLHPQTVEVGITSDTAVEVKLGLSENDQVLLNPPANTPSSNANPFSRLFRFLGGGGNR